MTSVLAGRIILTPTQPVGSGLEDRAYDLLNRSRALYLLSYLLALGLRLGLGLGFRLALWLELGLRLVLGLGLGVRIRVRVFGIAAWRHTNTLSFVLHRMILSVHPTHYCLTDFLS